ncbi:MAG: N-acetylneuraminate synthase [Coriobacteriia bacterium]|jgi:N-acetylneuraminate synthase
MCPVRVIAEVGVNHNGSVDTALRMVEAAAEAGANIVKFQTFSASSLVSSSAPKAVYQAERTGGGGQLEMLRALELTRGDHIRLMDACRSTGVIFLSAPFDLDSVDLLAGLGVSEVKIASGEITDLPLLRRVGAMRVPVVLSTGMSTTAEIAAAIAALEAAGAPRDGITLLHCTSEYPTPAEDVNLLAMTAMAEEFGLPVGYSDHTEGIEIALAAVARGAVLIEKHFTLDRSMPGPDHAASLEPGEFAEMVRGIRTVERALGDPVKRPAAGESGVAAVARKSIVAARGIEPGELLSDANLTTKRPATGISPMRWDEVVGTRASRSYARDEVIEP